MSRGATLDDALVIAGQLRDELDSIDKRGLAVGTHALVADAEDMVASATRRIEEAIAIDDEQHPEER